MPTFSPEPQACAQVPPAAPSRRFEDWPARLEAFIAAERHQPFAWGQRDCCLFASNGVRAITGLDPAAEVFRGRYHGMTDAMRLVREHGGVEAIAERQLAALGFAEWINVALARRGDLVLVDTLHTSGPALGICLGRHAAFVGFQEIQQFPLAKCRRAWRID